MIEKKEKVGLNEIAETIKDKWDIDPDKDEIKKIVKYALEAIVEHLENDKVVELTGYFSFEARDQEEKEKQSFGKTITVPAKKVVKVKVLSKVKSRFEALGDN